MRKQLYPVIVLIAALLIYRHYRHKTDSSDTLTYRGQTIKLSKSYSEYEDYKDDPDNIAAGELPKVQLLVETAPIAKHYASRDELLHVLSEIQFPGYGSTQFGDKPQTDGMVLSMWSVEIPHADRERYFLFRGNGNVFNLLDDFTVPDDPAIAAVKVEGNRLIYSTRQGTNVIERTVMVQH